MKKSTFDPSAPLPDFILNQFIKETAEKEKPEEKRISLPPEFQVAQNAKQIKEDRKEKARAQLDEIMNRKGIKRVNYGTVLADKSKNRVPSADFANVSDSKTSVRKTK